MFGIFSLILALVPSIVKGIQTVVGDKANGATKAQMAHDALAAAVNGAGAVFTGNNQAYSQLAGEIAQIAIDQTVTIAKATGAYSKWTAIATAAATDVATVEPVTGAIGQIQGHPTQAVSK